jgi:hypothetical protein
VAWKAAWERAGIEIETSGSNKYKVVVLISRAGIPYRDTQFLVINTK